MSKVLVINPGSTSTKLALYEDITVLWQENIAHDKEELRQFSSMFAQIPFRYELICRAMKAHGNSFTELSCVMSRGGLLPPLASGAYRVNEEMIDVLEHNPVNHHASNLGAPLGYKIAEPLGIPAYIYDPVTVDEMIDVVRVTGLKEILRHGQGHNLNMRATALRFCKENGLRYKDKTLIVAHLGGGITLTLHSKGRIIDMISDDEGPFSPERAGLIPNYKLAAYIFQNGLDYMGTMQTLQRRGGLLSLVGTSDAREVERLAQSGDKDAALAYDAMALGVAQSIARLSADVCGQVDAILLTGGIAYSAIFTEKISSRISFIAPVTVLAGENEMQALAEGAHRVLSGEEIAQNYQNKKEIKS